MTIRCVLDGPGQGLYVSAGLTRATPAKCGPRSFVRVNVILCWLSVFTTVAFLLVIFIYSVSFRSFFLGLIIKLATFSYVNAEVLVVEHVASWRRWSGAASLVPGDRSGVNSGGLYRLEGRGLIPVRFCQVRKPFIEEGALWSYMFIGNRSSG